MVSTSVTCNVTGNTVALKVILSESVGRIAWVIRMYSNVDQGKGGDTGLADYPYFVENINNTTNPYPDYYNTTKTYAKAGNYLAELALDGLGVQDQCAYTIGTTLPPTNTSSCNGTVCNPTGGSLPAGCPGTPCVTTVPPPTGTCSGINIPILGCQSTTVVIAGVGILILMMTMMKKGR